jgi:pyruvate dehydrogenase E1 component
MNDNYVQPPMPRDDIPVEEGILKGAYRFQASPTKNDKLRAQLLGSGAILNEVIKAQAILAEKYNVEADVWSVTSYKALRQDAKDTERWNMLHPTEDRREPYVGRCFGQAPGVFVAASDYVKSLPDSIARWIPGRLQSLGTDGYGRSEDRATLRDFFEVDARYVTLATLESLAREGQLDTSVVAQAIKDLDIDTEKANPLHT